MFKCDKLSWPVICVILAFLMSLGSAQAQDVKTCLFISEEAGPHPNDEILVDWLDQQYIVEITTGNDVNAHLFTPDDFKEFDFVFVSESISSSDTKDLKGAPVPIFYTELWSSKWDITGWVPTNTSGTYYENTTEKVVLIVNDDHPLAAGFSAGTEITISDSTLDPNGAILTYSVPQIDFINIAVLAADPTRTVVMGVEAGTALYNAENVNDGSLVSENRCAAVGINATSNTFITDDGFKLIDAGIKWILGEETGVEEKAGASLGNFVLQQNYPNPFNSATNISFTLTKADHASLTVHNALGQLVATLIDENLNAGTYAVTFNATELPSGVYLYQMRSGDLTQVKKMINMK
jgi:hypothetical protein